MEEIKSWTYLMTNQSYQLTNLKNKPKFVEQEPKVQVHKPGLENTSYL